MPVKKNPGRGDASASWMYNHTGFLKMEEGYHPLSGGITAVLQRRGTDWKESSRKVSGGVT